MSGDYRANLTKREELASKALRDKGFELFCYSESNRYRYGIRLLACGREELWIYRNDIEAVERAAQAQCLGDMLGLPGFGSVS
jgi:hypothetical protein